jgi:hypothetical protein
VTICVRACGILVNLFGATQQNCRVPAPVNLSQIFAVSAHHEMRWRIGTLAGRSGYESGYVSPSYSDTTPIDNSASDAAASQAAEDSAAASALMQAVQEQNDEANAETNAGFAAAQQTEIDCGM